MDAGCEYEGYTSDITRVWPTSGRFSSPQKLIYEAVLDVQLRLIELLEKQDDLVSILISQVTSCLISHILTVYVE